MTIDDSKIKNILNSIDEVHNIRYIFELIDDYNFEICFITKSNELPGLKFPTFFNLIQNLAGDNFLTIKEDRYNHINLTISNVKEIKQILSNEIFKQKLKNFILKNSSSDIDQFLSYFPSYKILMFD